MQNTVHFKEIIEIPSIAGQLKENKEYTPNAALSPEAEEQSAIKYIGYNPVNIFAQSEPLNYPYVIMPQTNSPIKFPRKGRKGRKGYTEDKFKSYIQKYFSESFQVFDDRFVLTKNSSNPFEPDFTLIDEQDGLNIFLDIEIDEPYDGLNKVDNRKATHYQYADYNRNNAFKNRGWIVIRFAEIQVHQQPDSCCSFIADVIKSINAQYRLPADLLYTSKVKLVKQWTKIQAETWSQEGYREQYLGIVSFGAVNDNYDGVKIEESPLGQEIELLIRDEAYLEKEIAIIPPNLEIIQFALIKNKYLSFVIDDQRKIMKPLKLDADNLRAFCYIKNAEVLLSADKLKEIILKDSYFTIKIAGPTIGIEKIANAVHTAIAYDKYIRMKYTRAAWQKMLVDSETGELIMDRIEAEESTRTINNIALSIDVLSTEHLAAYQLGDNYITAYCNKRNEKRTFKFERIGEIEILDL